MAARGPAAALAALALLGVAPAAQANDFQRIYQDWRQDQQLGSCRWSDRQLSRAEHQTPADIQQYAPSFVDALDSARQARASGACAPKAALPGAAGSPTGRAGSQVAPTPGPAATAAARIPNIAPAIPTGQQLVHGADPPVPVWLLAGLGGLAACVMLLAVLARIYGWSLERFVRPWRAAAIEAGGRTADFAHEFWEWLRLGR